MSTDDDSRLLGLEVIRFASAMAVLVWHYQHFAYVGSAPMDFVRERQPFHALLAPLYEHGHHGVQLFWCISGFIFFWKYRQSIADRTVDAWTFAVLRFSRLYPLHLATLLLVAGLQAAYVARQGVAFVYEHNDLAHFGLQLALASQWGLQRGYSFNGPIWSISVEVLVYAVFFVAVRRGLGSPRFLLAIVLGCAIAKAARIASPVVDCLMYFHLGGLSAFAFRHVDRSPHRDRLLVAALAWVVAVPAVAAAAHAYGGLRIPTSVMALHLPALVLLGACRLPVTPRVGRAIEAAGNLTYSSYLLHFPIQLAIVLAFAHAGRPVPYLDPTFLVAWTLATLAAAYASYRLLERPAQDALRRRLLGARPARAAAG